MARSWILEQKWYVVFRSNDKREFLDGSPLTHKAAGATGLMQHMLIRFSLLQCAVDEYEMIAFG